MSEPSADTSAQIDFFAASDGFELQVYRWVPADEPLAIVHIAHGMGEHVARYSGLAAALVADGYEVVAQNHRGHGSSAAAADALGDFGAGGWPRVITDQNELIQHSQQRHPGVPVVLLGHSMGASLTQNYLTEHAEGLAGVVLSGSPGFSGRFGRLVAYLLARWESWRHGPATPSERLGEQLFGKANDAFEGDLGSEWLSRDLVEVQRYADDPLCGFVLRPGSLVSYLDGIRQSKKKRNVARIPQLPIYLFSGSDDPVHANMANIDRMVQAYRGAGLKVEQRIYPSGRHETLNETNRGEVIEDLRNWLRGLLAQ